MLWYGSVFFYVYFIYKFHTLSKVQNDDLEDGYKVAHLKTNIMNNDSIKQ